MFSAVVHRQALEARQVLGVAAPVRDPAVVEAAAQAQAAGQVGAVVGQVAVVVVRMSKFFSLTLSIVIIFLAVNMYFSC